MKLVTIKKNIEFNRVYKRGQSVAGAFIVLYRLKRSEQTKRFGITVSKKVGKAVVRNRVRRLIRQSITDHFQLFDDGYDYVFVARVRAQRASLLEIAKNMRYLLAMFRKKQKKWSIY